MTPGITEAVLRDDIRRLARRTNELAARYRTGDAPTAAELLDHQRFKCSVLQRVVAHGEEPKAAVTLAEAMKRLREMEARA